jgi:hypothetical protein
MILFIITHSQRTCKGFAGKKRRKTKKADAERDSASAQVQLSGLIVTVQMPSF